MVSANLVLGAAVGRPNVQALAGKAPADGIDAEGNADKSTGGGRRIFEDRSSDVYLDRAIVEIQAWNECKGIRVGPAKRPGLPDFERIAPAVAHSFHGHIVGSD